MNKRRTDECHRKSPAGPRLLLKRPAVPAGEGHQVRDAPMRPDVNQRRGTGRARRRASSPAAGRGTIDAVGADDHGRSATGLRAVAGWRTRRALRAPGLQRSPVPREGPRRRRGAPRDVLHGRENVLRPCSQSGIRAHPRRSSGSGRSAIQPARASAVSSATAASAKRAAARGRLGAELAINYRDADFVAVIVIDRGPRRRSDSRHGRRRIVANLDALAVDGRLVQIAVLGGARAQVNMVPILQRRLTVTGSTLRPRSVAEKGAIARALHDRVWPLLESGVVAPVVFQTFPLQDAAAAHRVMESSVHIGKLVLVVSQQ